MLDFLNLMPHGAKEAKLDAKDQLVRPITAADVCFAHYSCMNGVPNIAPHPSSACCKACEVRLHTGHAQ